MPDPGLEAARSDVIISPPVLQQLGIDVVVHREDLHLSAHLVVPICMPSRRTEERHRGQ